MTQIKSASPRIGPPVTQQGRGVQASQCYT